MDVGLRSRYVGEEWFTWRDLLVFVEESGRDSALFRAKHPEWAEWNNTNMLLAQLVDNTNIQIWQKTKNGRRGRMQPDPIPRPGVEARSRRVKGEALPIDQFKEKMAELRKRVAVSSTEERVRSFKSKGKSNGN